jgi:predicted GNAT family acetyltransferase
MALTVVDNPDRSRFELRDGERVLGFTEYHERDDGVVVFPHTVITSPERGAGYGSTLVQGALDVMRERGRTIVAQCPFVARFVAEHPDYADLLAA